MSSDHAQTHASSVRPTPANLGVRRRIRHFNDNAARVLISIGGVGVIVTILLIFLYLFYEVVPLFRSASVSEAAAYSIPSNGADTLHLAIDEQGEIAVRLSDEGIMRFFHLSDGEEVRRFQIPLPDSADITSFALDSEESGVFALGLSDGSALVAQYEFETSFEPPDNRRIITPVLSYPFGGNPVQLTSGSPLTGIAVRTRGNAMLLAGVTGSGALSLARASVQSGLFTAFDPGGSANVNVELFDIGLAAPGTQRLYIEGDFRWLFTVAGNGLLRMADLRAAQQGGLSAFTLETFLTGNRGRPTNITFLLGGVSLLVADSAGEVGQWLLTRAEDTVELSKIRAFTGASNPISALTAEQRRKNFVTGDTGGNVSLFNTTAHRTVYSGALAGDSIQSLAISPRGDALLVETPGNRYTVWNVDNEHPEVSWEALWNRVWYEGYSEPEYIWQSSGATNEFEPKYSLMPLSFGTVKAAFYAMVLAAPLAICGAIFTGYFMAPAMRRKVKPLIELMEALPTVVLGFLAGLWLAPFVENNLLSIITLLILLPAGIILASLLWLYLPKRLRHAVDDGWEAALLIPVILLFGYLSFLLAAPLESLLFNGDLRFWLTSEMGIGYDQRNAMVVGFAMGFAVIPTIFSIAEDAIFQVPRQLTYGSLALGATPWQSLYRVVLPTASPGIFSALMIGMGRAVGETMIVLMATGNTPIMDINLFEGMRTLAANIAVEIPESEVDSTHYRILFLAALVLFTFTFVINTIAELVRQRLRIKYSTL